jgi:hypothetical protein
MCSNSQQPKMFLNPMSIGSGGEFSTPTQYQSNPQATAAASPVAPPPVAPVAPAAPATAAPANPAKPKTKTGTLQIGSNLLQQMTRRAQ